jgi:hypothetical protein
LIFLDLASVVYYVVNFVHHNSSHTRLVSEQWHPEYSVKRAEQ